MSNPRIIALETANPTTSFSQEELLALTPYTTSDGEAFSFTAASSIATCTWTGPPFAPPRPRTNSAPGTAKPALRSAAWRFNAPWKRQDARGERSTLW